MDFKLLLLGLFTFLSFAGFLFYPVFSDPDSYYFLGAICHDKTIENNFSLFPFLINFLPCNFFVLKLINMALFFICSFFVLKAGELFDKENGWLVGFLFAGTTFFVTEAWKFENDLFGYAFGFAGIYFALKFYFSKNIIDLALSIVLFVVGGLLWQGIIYMVFSVAPFSIWFLVVGLFFAGLAWLLHAGASFFWFVNASELVAEQQRLVSIIYLGLPSFFSMGGLLSSDWRLILAFALSLIPALFISKLFVLPLLFACLLSLNALKAIFKDNHHFKVVAFSIVVLCFFMAVFFGSLSVRQFPTASDVELIRGTIDENRFVVNDFSSGHIIRFYGGETACFASLCDFELKGRVLVIKAIDTPNCGLVSESSYLKLVQCSNKPYK